MTGFLLGAVIVLILVVFVLLGATTELFRDVRQLEEAMGILDKPSPIGLRAAGLRPSLHNLPPELDEAEFAVILLLSDRCGTCASILGALKGHVPEKVTLLVESSNRQRGTAWLRRSELTWDDNVLFDEEARIADAVGVFTTPAAIVINDGLFSTAMTVPSSRQLTAILSKQAAIKPEDEPQAFTESTLSELRNPPLEQGAEAL
jgi:hypothetical protein